jgi:MFS family permease
VAAPALRQLLEPAQYPQIPAYLGMIFAINLLGWGVGGVIGGIVADYIGRKRTMIFAIIAYSLTTGLSALAFDWLSFALLRFLVGVAIGSEWATGASMIAEQWPDRARGKGAGLMQCGLGIGFFIAALTWLFVSGIGPGAWRVMFVIGVLPALVTLWIRAGAVLQGEDAALARFTAFDLFADPAIRRRTVIVFLMSLTTTLGWWSIATWVPPFIGAVAGKAGLPGPQWQTYAGLAYTTGSIIGYAGFGFLADAFGRKPVTIVFFLLALVLTPVLFLWAQDLHLLLVLACLNAIFTNGQYSWMPVWLPELYPTRMRATAMAFVFNAPRFIAFLGPLFGGQLIVYFGGFGYAATLAAGIYILGLAAVAFLPETVGKPLPDKV